MQEFSIYDGISSSRIPRTERAKYEFRHACISFTDIAKIKKGPHEIAISPLGSFIIRTVEPAAIVSGGLCKKDGDGSDFDRSPDRFSAQDFGCRESNENRSFSEYKKN